MRRYPHTGPCGSRPWRRPGWPPRPGRAGLRGRRAVHEKELLERGGGLVQIAGFHRGLAEAQVHLVGGREVGVVIQEVQQGFAGAFVVPQVDQDDRGPLPGRGGQRVHRILTGDDLVLGHGGRAVARQFLKLGHREMAGGQARRIGRPHEEPTPERNRFPNGQVFQVGHRRIRLRIADHGLFAREAGHQPGRATDDFDQAVVVDAIEAEHHGPVSGRFAHVLPSNVQPRFRHDAPGDVLQRRAARHGRPQVHAPAARFSLEDGAQQRGRLAGGALVEHFLQFHFVQPAERIDAGRHVPRPGRPGDRERERLAG